MSINKYAGHDTIDSQPRRWYVVVPNDNTDLPEVPKALYFGGAGNVALQGSDGNSIVKAVAAGDELWWSPTRILATGTTVTAGNIIALVD